MDYIVWPKKETAYYEQKLKSFDQTKRHSECKGQCPICENMKQETIRHLKFLIKE